MPGKKHRRKARVRPAVTILIDTCVWLDMAKDFSQLPLLGALEELVRLGYIQLIAPHTLLDEFARNKVRIIEEGARSLTGTLKRAADVIAKYGEWKRTRKFISAIHEAEQKLGNASDFAAQAIARIETLLGNARAMDTTDDIKLRAAQRAIDKRAPFHRQRNNINDAILIETYADSLTAAKSGERFAFITHNVKDFSHPAGNEKFPHPDFAPLFSRIRSRYFITLGEALRGIRPEEFADIMIEQEWADSRTRRVSEIVAAIDELVTKVWYNRHQIWKEKIEAGEIAIVEKETFPVKDHATRPIQRDIWEGAKRAAAKVEKRFGIENLGPWDDFEWGMLNGKLSALRWALGEEWDMLDT
jgi:hypothetical protein